MAGMKAPCGGVLIDNTTIKTNANKELVAVMTALVDDVTIKVDEDGKLVVGAGQMADIADLATEALLADVIAKVNALLAALRTNGLLITPDPEG